MSESDRPGRRRWLRIALIFLLLVPVVLGVGYWFMVSRVHGQTRRRAAWLDRAEAEIPQTLLRGLADPAMSEAARWLGPDFAVFDRGGAAWRVHTFHMDPGEGTDWSGLGNIAVLIDDKGQKYYSRTHFCDGTLPWAFGSPDRPPPPRPPDFGAFLQLFSPGSWTTDRSVVEAALQPR